MIPRPVPLTEIPPGAWTVGPDGLPRQTWYVPPATMVTLDPATGATYMADLNIENIERVEILAYVPDLAEVVVMLTTAFGPIERIE